jgi:hypothetical protein
MKELHRSFEFAEKVCPTEFQRPSMFEGHLLQPINAEALLIPDSFSAWIFALLLFCFMMSAWLLIFGIRHFQRLPNAFFGNRGFTRLAKERAFFSQHLLLPLIILALLCLSLFVLRIGMMYEWWEISGVETLLIFGQIVLFIGLLYLVKIALVKIVAWIFKEQASARLYIMNLLLFNVILAMLLLPFLLMSFFGDTWFQANVVYGMMILFAVWFVWRAIRNYFVLISATKFSYVHNFLYLCALEIGFYLSVFLILNQH